MRLLLYLKIFLALLFLTGCGAAVTQLQMQEPETGKALLVGAVLVENNGLDDVYEAVTGNINVIIVGKHIENTKEIIQGYRLETDENGYYYLSNVPQGAYVLKGIEVNMGYSGRMLITSRWDGPRQIYVPESRLIDYVVRNWPEEVKSPVNDMGIRYIKVDPSQQIYTDNFHSLKDNSLALKNIRHTMPNPIVYFRGKYPEIKCLQEK